MKQEELMQNWEVMEAAIPRSFSDRIAHALRFSADQIRRWRREPVADESPRANGQYSPLDRLLDLVDAVFLHHRAGAALLVNHVNAHYQRLAYPNSELLTIDTSPEERNRAVAQLLQSGARAADVLSREGITRESVFALVEHQRVVGELAACATQDLDRAEGGRSLSPTAHFQRR